MGGGSIANVVGASHVGALLRNFGYRVANSREFP